MELADCAAVISVCQSKTINFKLAKPSNLCPLHRPFEKALSYVFALSTHFWAFKLRGYQTSCHPGFSSCQQLLEASRRIHHGQLYNLIELYMQLPNHYETW